MHPIPCRWPGATVAVIGGGPSLNQAQLEILARAHGAGCDAVIAVNHAIRVYRHADWLHAADGSWWRRNPDAIRLCGTRTTLSDDLPRAWGIETIPATGVDGFDESGALRTGRNSGYQAAQIALHAGAARVILLGIDMRLGADGSRHHHTRYADDFWYAGRPADDYEHDMLPFWPALALAAKRRKAEIVNCSPVSAIDCFPRQDLALALHA